jgi:hypothetical protein
MMKYPSISELVSSGHSKSLVNKIIRAVGNDQRRFDELIKIFLGKDGELARKSSWALGYIATDHPQLVRKWLSKILANLSRENQHPAMYRNTFRFLEEIDIPEKHAAEVLNAAYRYTLNAAHPVAIRAFAMTTAWNVVKKYPELAEELRIVTEQVMTEESPAIRSRGNLWTSQLQSRSLTPEIHANAAIL